jgi:GNAT superfamily N-acetyltransferase
VTLSIRTARPDERNALEDLQRRASLMWDEYRPFLLANPEAIALPLAQLQEGWVRVAEDAGRVLGFSALVTRGRGFDLDGLFVEPAHWGRGVGRALVRDAVARADGAELTVLANPRAEGFYLRLGFAVTGREQTLFGPANRMILADFPRD